MVLHPRNSMQPSVFDLRFRYPVDFASLIFLWSQITFDKVKIRYWLISWAPHYSLLWDCRAAVWAARALQLTNNKLLSNAEPEHRQAYLDGMCKAAQQKLLTVALYSVWPNRQSFLWKVFTISRLQLSEMVKLGWRTCFRREASWTCWVHIFEP